MSIAGVDARAEVLQRLGRFAKAREVPVVVVEHMRRCLELNDDVAPADRSVLDALQHALTYWGKTRDFIPALCWPTV